MFHSYYSSVCDFLSLQKYPVALLLLLGVASAIIYQNDWDEPLLFSCSGHQSISRIRSVHHNHYEDRKWRLDCRNLPGGVSACTPESCQWTTSKSSEKHLLCVQLLHARYQFNILMPIFCNTTSDWMRFTVGKKFDVTYYVTFYWIA